jgi:hypothetical protein
MSRFALGIVLALGLVYWPAQAADKSPVPGHYLFAWAGVVFSR